MTIHVGASGSHKEVLSVHVGSGGGWKAVEGVWVGAGGVWKPAFSSRFRASLTVGSPGGFPTYYGYVDEGYGSLTPNLIPPSSVQIAVWAESFDDNTCVVQIRGFSSDPGQDFFESAGLVGAGYLPSAAAAYFYSGGVATWQWSIDIVGAWGLPNGETVDVELVF